MTDRNLTIVVDIALGIAGGIVVLAVIYALVWVWEVVT